MRRVGEASCVVGLFLLGACSGSGGADFGFGDGGAPETRLHKPDAHREARQPARTPGVAAPIDTGSPDTSTGPKDSASTDVSVDSIPFTFDELRSPRRLQRQSPPIAPTTTATTARSATAIATTATRLVNPCAFDTNAASGDPVGSDGIDNDCDGMIDNLRLCDDAL